MTHAIAVPPYLGEYYEDRVPDTIDLAEMAELAINCLTESTNPACDYDIYFWFFIRVGSGHDAPYRNPPILKADCSSWCHMKFAEALPLMRIMSGSRQNLNVDQAWMNYLLENIGPDGLFYWPVGKRPYYRSGAAWMGDGIFDSAGKPHLISDESITQFTHPLSGRYLGVMSLYYLREGNAVYQNGTWRKAMDRMVDRWNEIVIDRGAYAYFPAAGYAPNAAVPRDLKMPMNITGEECNNRLIQGLAQYYRLTKYEPARRLAGKLVNYMRYQVKWFDEQGRWIDGNPTEFSVDFFHAYTITLLSMLEHATAVNDRELIDFVNKSFNYGINQQVSPSSRAIGWFPENLRPDYPSSELCGVADMIALAIKLSEAGAGDYLDDVDRWTRNMLREGQLREGNWIRELAEQEPPTPVEKFETADHAIERSIGGFSGWITPSEWAIRHGIMHCCTGNATRALYYVWKNMLRFERGALKLNLLMNRASRWVDVYSHLPYRGQVDVRVKRRLRQLEIRSPEWIVSGSAELACTVNDQPTTITWNGRYFKLGALNPDDRLTVTFPIHEKVHKERIGGVDYTFKIKGNDVMSVDPPGSDYPRFQRGQYAQSETQWLPRRRFVSAENIAW